MVAASRIALSQTYLKADMTAVQINALSDKGLRTTHQGSLDHQDLQHPGLVSGIGGASFFRSFSRTFSHGLLFFTHVSINFSQASGFQSSLRRRSEPQEWSRKR